MNQHANKHGPHEAQRIRQVVLRRARENPIRTLCKTVKIEKRDRVNIKPKSRTPVVTAPFAGLAVMGT